MRFQDWDVLLFPGARNVPLQEFRTACFAVQEGSLQTPTLVTYIPSLPRGSPFEVSIHSWTKAKYSTDLSLYHGYTNHDQTAWGVRIIVDGVCVSSSTFSAQVPWPQVISLSDHASAKGQMKRLTFPAFHRSVLTRRTWNIAEDLGRIKIILSEGFKTSSNLESQFQPVRNIACFSFHAAPMEYLDRCNISWPNQVMFMGPLKPGPASLGHAPNMQMPQQMHHQMYHQDSHSSLDSGFYSSAANMAPPPPPNQYPFRAFASLSHPYSDMHSVVSRSTSDSSVNGFLPGFNYSAMMHDNASKAPQMSQPSLQPSSQQARRSVEVRLPSDQLQQLITALSPKNTRTGQSVHMKAPQAQMTRPSISGVQRQLSYGGVLPAQPFTGVNAAYTHRTDSHHQHRSTSDMTDISMHVGCTEFPDCTLDDPQSRLGVSHLSPRVLKATVDGVPEGVPDSHANDPSSDAVAGIRDRPWPLSLGPGTDRATPFSSNDDKPAEDADNEKSVRISKKRNRSVLASLECNDSLTKAGSGESPKRKISKGDVLLAKELGPAEKENDSLLDVF